MRRFVFLLTLLIAITTSAMADGPCVIPGRGHFRIHVGTGGLFGSFAHDHEIEAQKIEGCGQIDAANLAHSSIKLIFTTADIRVIDPKESTKNRAEIQKNMDQDVLRISEFPRITFESTGVEASGSSGPIRVTGNLTIREKTAPATISLTLSHQDDGTYRATGRYSFKQSTFGIKPIQLAGGTVKVKDELQTEFDLYLK